MRPTKGTATSRSLAPAHGVDRRPPGRAGTRAAGRSPGGDRAAGSDRRRTRPGSGHGGDERGRTRLMIDRARFGAEFDETFRSLRFRNFRLFFGGQLISQIGNWLTLVAQSLLVLHLTDNNGVAVGVLTACQFLPVLRVRGLGRARRRPQRQAPAADRSSRRSPCCSRSCWRRWPSCGDPPLLALYAVAMAGGFATAFDNPARRAFVVEMVPETARPERGQPEPRADDRRPRRRPGAGRPADRDVGLRLVLRRRRPQLHRRDRRPVADEPGRAAPGAGGPPAQGSDPGRPALRPLRCPSCGCRW